MTTFEELPPGDSGLLSARPGPDLVVWDYVEREYVARGTAVSYAGHEPAAAVGSAMRASMRPYWKDLFVSVVMRHDVW